MRIAIFLDVKLNRNGVGSYFCDLASFFKEKNLVVDIYNSDGNIKVITSIKFPNDRTQKIAIPNYFNLKREFYKNKPELIFVSFYGPFSSIGVRMAKKLNIPYIYVINNDMIKFINQYYKGFLNYSLQKICLYLEKHLINNAGTVVLVNPNLQHIPDRYCPRSVITLGTLINSSFTNSQKPEPVTEINSVLYYGRLAIEKNIELVIESAKKLPHLIFNIAGEGPLTQTVEIEADNLSNLNYLGWIERENIIDTIENNDMVVMPSAFETFGTVALESLSRGRLVIIGDHHGIREFEILNDCLFNFTDYGSLDNAIKIISEFDSDKISEISNKSFESVREYDAHTKQAWYNLVKDVNSQL